jgi:hypothetical protein
MQLADHFDVLLKDTVNLSRLRLETLDSRVDAIYNALEANSELGPYVVDKIPQGSWAHETIIKPPGNTEFDADFMLLLDENPDWSDSPKTYIEKVYSAIHRHSTYGEMPHSRKCRCVRLVYANSCHVDIVPYLKLGDGRQVIVNRDNDQWEDTDPEGFTAWMREKDETANHNLRRVIRLMKYLRDHKNSFTGTRSVILTTLLGEQVSSMKKLFDADYYNGVPTTLLHVVNDLDEWLQANPIKPSIPDPSGSGATFDHRWDQTTYSYFRDRIHAHAAEIQDAYDEPDRDTSVSKWQAIFDDGFKAPTPKESSGRFGATAAGATTAIGRSGRAG